MCICVYIYIGVPINTVSERSSTSTTSKRLSRAASREKYWKYSSRGRAVGLGLRA